MVPKIVKTNPTAIYLYQQTLLSVDAIEVDKFLEIMCDGTYQVYGKAQPSRMFGNAIGYRTERTTG